MDFWLRLFELMTARASAAPRPYGVFHISMLLIMVALAAVLCTRFGKADEPTFKKLLISVWIVMIVGEIYHQLCFALTFEGGKLIFDYPWYKFPFQFCQTPLYALPLAIFLRDGRARDGVMAYLSSFSLFAGLAVLLYPADVFVDMIGVSIQTMIHHGLQVVLGIFLLARYKARLGARYFSLGIPIFAAFLTVALVMNLTAYRLIVDFAPDESFNMFFISPYFECNLPVLSEVYTALPYPLFLAVYFFGFILVSAVLFNLMHLIFKFPESERARMFLRKIRRKRS